MTSHFGVVDCYQSGSFEGSSYSRKDRRVLRTRQHPSDCSHSSFVCRIWSLSELRVQDKTVSRSPRMIAGYV